MSGIALDLPAGLTPDQVRERFGSGKWVKPSSSITNCVTLHSLAAGEDLEINGHLMYFNEDVVVATDSKAAWLFYIYRASDFREQLLDKIKAGDEVAVPTAGLIEGLKPIMKYVVDIAILS